MNAKITKHTLVKVMLLVALSTILTPSVAAQGDTDVVKTVPKIQCIDETSVSTGSGVIISADGYIVTNKHVVTSSAGDLFTQCFVGISDSIYLPPAMNHVATVLIVASGFDLALLKINNPPAGMAFIPIYAYDTPKLGAEIEIYGYPALGGDTITYTNGHVSGFIKDPEYPLISYIKTDALIEYGNSGGGAFTKAHELIGIPTSAAVGELNTLGVIIQATTVRDFLYFNDYRNLIHVYARNDYGGEALKEYQYNETVPAPNVPVMPPPLPPVVIPTYEVDPKLVNKLKGYILLQVESVGEAWYVNPIDGKRYYMKDGAVAYEMLRRFGLGITDSNLAKIPAEGTNNKGDQKLTERLQGRILLQIQQHGEAWYVLPKTGKRIYMKDGSAAYEIMRQHSLGITNENLMKIPVGSL